jgi:hypothetical protein
MWQKSAMTKTHPDVDVTEVRTWLSSRDELLEKMLSSVRGGRDSVDCLFGFLKNAASYRLSINETSAALCENLKLATQVGAAIFLLASHSSGEMEVNLGSGSPIKLTATGPTSVAHIGKFLDTFFLAVICRDYQSLDNLSRVPMASIRASVSTGQECHYLLGETLQRFWNEDDQTSTVLLEALKATDPATLTSKAAEGFALEVIVPEIDCLYRFFLSDADAFNAALEKGVEWHRKHWTRGEKKKDPSGFFALGLTALAALAFDHDLPITVDSPYLPRFLIEGGCTAKG